MLNEFTLQGRLCSEPTQKFTADGQPYITFNLAISRNRRVKNVLYYDFIQCRAAGRIAELVLSSVVVGQEIIVTGSMRSVCSLVEGRRVRTDQYPRVERVFFARPKTIEEVPDKDTTAQDIVQIAKDMSGFDENGYFPGKEEEEVIE